MKWEKTECKFLHALKKGAVVLGAMHLREQVNIFVKLQHAAFHPKWLPCFFRSTSYLTFQMPQAAPQPGFGASMWKMKNCPQNEAVGFFFRGPADVTPNTKYGLPFAYFVSSLFFQVNYGERRKQQNHPNDNISFKNIPCPTAVSSGPLYTSCSTEFARLIHSSEISTCTCPHGSSVLLGQGRIPAPPKPPGNALFHHFH